MKQRDQGSACTELGGGDWQETDRQCIIRGSYTINKDRVEKEKESWFCLSRI